MPVRVELVGSFTDWQPVALKRDRASGVWQVALHNIPGNRTHSYMLLVNRRPVPDRHADGLAVPHTAEELKYQLLTARGPRVFMLNSQTK
jgi:1,4-alpha-glucan branching enzyme